MYLSVIIDAAALAVLILFARKGWRRGVVRTLSELIVVVLAMILAGKIADVAARQAVEYMRPAAHAAAEACPGPELSHRALTCSRNACRSSSFLAAVTFSISSSSS